MTVRSLSLQSPKLGQDCLQACHPVKWPQEGPESQRIGRPLWEKLVLDDGEDAEEVRYLTF